MEFNQDNEVVRLCIEGMEFEGKGEPENASARFMSAWDKAESAFEKFTSAHYVARHQSSVREKLQWDQTALQFALRVEDAGIKGTLPSLYLNIGKCHEDLDDFENARASYLAARTYFDFLPMDGYGNMIKAGVHAGLERVSG